jgi:multidrug resistance efflux pump
MLNISDNHLPSKAYPKALLATEKTRLPAWHWTFRRLLAVLLIITLFFLFLPWTQNVRADGRVTTLRPEQRPQTGHATISGRIEHWYVAEGQAIKRGDTLVFLSEVKSEYFDPELVARVGDQVAAKKGSIQSYDQKAGALEDQIGAMRRELESKLQQTRNKIEQARLKIQSDTLKVVQARIDLQVAQRQLSGAKNLYDKGLEPLTKFEERRLKLQDAETKLVSAENQLGSSRNDLSIYTTELRLLQNETANKIAKAQSDRFSTISDRFDAQANVSKLQIDRENYARRQSFYYILAPQDGFVVQAIKPGIGEIIKEGEPLLSIQPADYQLAVEMYVKPLDLPLLSVGSGVRFIFDGWPAFFFSGWPGVSLGTFGGQVVAIDRNISSNGKFRVLVAPTPNDFPWPTAIMPGGGAKGIALLSDVPVWYELWRVVNGFPPDLYKSMPGSGNKDKEGKK